MYQKGFLHTSTMPTREAPEPINEFRMSHPTSILATTYYRLLKDIVLLLQRGARGSTTASSKRRAGPWCGGIAGCWRSSGGTRRRSGGRSGRDGASLSLTTRHWVIVVAWEVLVPIPLCELQKLEVVLHLAFHQLSHGDRLVDMVFRKSVCSQGVSM
jgi:hypothetical protein